MMKYRYFNESDFINAVPSCSIDDMNVGFMNKLDTARHISGIPFIINSAYRNLDWERANARTGLSSHTKGIGVDISCNCSYDRLLIVKALLDVGFKRIGIYKSFIHVDGDLTKVECIFLG